MKAVVAGQNDGCIRAGYGHQLAKHGIVPGIGIADTVPVKLGNLVVGPGSVWRVIGHESVPEVVGRVEINCCEVPLLRLKQLGGHRIGCHAFANQLRKRVQALIACLIHFVKVRHKGPQHLAGDLIRAHAQVTQQWGQLGWMHTAGRHWLLGQIFALHIAEPVRDNGPVDRLGRVARPPAHHHRTLALLVQNVPDRLRLAAFNGDRANGLAIGRDF